MKRTAAARGTALSAVNAPGGVKPRQPRSGLACCGGFFADRVRLQALTNGQQSQLTMLPWDMLRGRGRDTG